MGSARPPEDLRCSVVHPGPRKRVSWVGAGGSQAPAPHARCLHRKLRLTQPVSLLTCCPPAPAGAGEVGGVGGGGDRGMLQGSWERRDREAGPLPRSPEGRGRWQVTPAALRRTRLPQAWEPAARVSLGHTPGRTPLAPGASIPIRLVPAASLPESARLPAAGSPLADQSPFGVQNSRRSTCTTPSPSFVFCFVF